MSMSGTFRACIAITLFTVLSPFEALRAVPPPHGRPVGDWPGRKPGEFLDRVVLTTEDNGLRVVLPTPGDGFPIFDVRADSSNRSCRNLRLTFGASSLPPLASSLHHHGHYFNVTQRDVIPIYGHLYRIDCVNRDDIALTRVTNDVPPELQPATKSRTIVVGEKHATLFSETYFLKRRWDLDYTVVLDIDPQKLRAKVTLEPQGKDPPGQAARQVVNVTVRKGDLLSARGRAYRVLNVVPPQMIDGVGNLVGWIEISADPVDPTEE